MIINKILKPSFYKDGIIQEQIPPQRSLPYHYLNLPLIETLRIEVNKKRNGFR